MGKLYHGPIAFVDVETTGSGPRSARVIEVGIVAARDGALEYEWSTLIDPGVRVPPAIRLFTGITEEMLRGAPSFAQIAGELSERLAGRLFVAHTARFDHGFLREELRRTGRSLGGRMACTVKLSRRLVPEARAHHLDALIERYGISCERRRRALPDARALWHFWQALATRHSETRIESALGEILAARSVPPHLPPSLADELPEGPGVYRFFGEGGALLYVGKAKNIRERVFAHWHAALSDARAERLAAATRHVDFIETAGELGALLTEARLVRELKPLHNRRLRGARGAWTWVIADDGAAPELAPLEQLPLSFERSDPFGLYRSERAARRALTALAREHQLCLKVLGLERASGSCFAYQLGRCRGTCVGAEPLRLHTARLKLAFAPERLPAWPYEGAVGIREACTTAAGVRADVHVVEGWRHLGPVRDGEPSERWDPRPPFDPDIYQILRRHLRLATGREIVRIPAGWSRGVMWPGGDEL